MIKSYRIFLSHGGDDTYVVESLLKPKVEATGATVFIDVGKIEYGDDFRKTILTELDLCDELLVLFTKSSLTKPWVLAEVGATLIREKRIVAIRYGPTEVELQKLGILSLLGTRSIMRIDDFDKYIQQLKRRVEANNNE